MASEQTKNEEEDRQENRELPVTKAEGEIISTVSKGTLIVAEDRETGVVSWKVISGYTRSIGNTPAFVIMFLMYIFSEACRVGGSYWITVWTEDALKKTTNFYILLYAVWSVGQGIATLVARMLVAYSGIQAARNLHSGMLDRLLRVPMQFFHQTPMGRITNRFTKDQGDVDRSLASMTSIFVSGVFQMIGTIVVIGYATPLTMVVLAPVLYVFYKCQRYFQNTSRELKRLDAVTRSPIYNHFSQSLDGLASIKAYRANERMFAESARRLDTNTAIIVANFSSNRWLAVRLELLGGLMVLASALLCVVARSADGGGTSAAIAGLALSYALQITATLNMIVRLGSVAENAFNSVERILAYSNLPTEAAHHLPESQMEPFWPSEGAVSFRDVSMRYRDELPDVLRGLNFDVRPREMIGIIGRTGAGKSSIFLALFRIVELSGGSITIDGENIKSLGLADLRYRLGIIPQDPVLFSGTIRSNLDPFDEYSDSEIWAALDRAHLKSFVLTKKGKLLDFEVQEHGANFSVGQRQLLCLARALLKRCRVLVLDEATAAVDPETDSLIQETIRTEFNDCTIITIAHRLNTIIDSHRVLVMEAGRAVEFDSPKNLLKNPDGLFSRMVDSTGPESAKFLRAAAEDTSKLHSKSETQVDTSRLRRRLSMVVDLGELTDVDLGKVGGKLDQVRTALLTLKDAFEESSDWESEFAEASLTPDYFQAQLHRYLGLLGQASPPTVSNT